MQTLSFHISGMTCGGCTSSVRRALSRIDGVSHAEVTLRPGAATVVVDPDRVTSAQIESVITGLGYPAKARTAKHDERVPS
jgi:copper chaperone CopZ